MFVLQAGVVGLQLVPLKVNCSIQEVQAFGSAPHSLHGNAHRGAQTLLTNLKEFLHSIQTPEAHVRQLTGHGLHDVIVPLVKTGSNPTAHLSHTVTWSYLQLVHPLVHLTQAGAGERVGWKTYPTRQVKQVNLLQRTQFSGHAVQAPLGDVTSSK